MNRDFLRATWTGRGVRNGEAVEKPRASVGLNFLTSQVRRAVAEHRFCIRRGFSEEPWGRVRRAKVLPEQGGSFGSGGRGQDRGPAGQ
jgi:hypothetical protein